MLSAQVPLVWGRSRALEPRPRSPRLAMSGMIGKQLGMKVQMFALLALEYLWPEEIHLTKDERLE